MWLLEWTTEQTWHPVGKSKGKGRRGKFSKKAVYRRHSKYVWRPDEEQLHSEPILPDISVVSEKHEPKEQVGSSVLLPTHTPGYRRNVNDKGKEKGYQDSKEAEQQTGISEEVLTANSSSFPNGLSILQRKTRVRKKRSPYRTCKRRPPAIRTMLDKARISTPAS